MRSSILALLSILAVVLAQQDSIPSTFWFIQVMPS